VAVSAETWAAVSATASAVATVAALGTVTVELVRIRRAAAPRLSLQALQGRRGQFAAIVVANAPTAGLSRSTVVAVRNGDAEFPCSTPTGYVYGGERIEVTTPWSTFVDPDLKAIVTACDSRNRMHVWDAGGRHRTYRVGPWPRRYRTWPDVLELLEQWYPSARELAAADT
jgi:hypothetical protein